MIETTWRYLGWVQVVMAAVAMVATLPGRTHGLGMITEPLLKDLQLGHVEFANVNFWATIIGSVFCLPAGQLLDRFGSRVTLTAVYLLLGGAVLMLTCVHAWLALLVAITLTRGFGQSALSVVSISMTGRWFDRRLSLATGIYSVLMSIGFAFAFTTVSNVLKSTGDWRVAWTDIAYTLFALAPISWLLVRHQPDLSQLAQQTEQREVTSEEGFELREALGTQAFWVFAAATSLFGMISAGFSLFNQAILAERGFDASTYYETVKMGFVLGLAGQAACVALARWLNYQKIVAIALAIYALSLAGLTQVSVKWQLMSCVVLMGVSGGMIVVVFFAIWPQMFGRRQLGRIQGAAQKATVLASALGPVLFAYCKQLSGTESFAPAIYLATAASILVAAIAAVTPTPIRSTETELAIEH